MKADAICSGERMITEKRPFVNEGRVMKGGREKEYRTFDKNVTQGGFFLSSPRIGEIVSEILREP